MASLSGFTGREETSKINKIGRRERSRSSHGDGYLCFFEMRNGTGSFGDSVWVGWLCLFAPTVFFFPFLSSFPSTHRPVGSLYYTLKLKG